MPCYSRETSTVEFGPGTNPGLLAAALKTLGYTVTKIGNNLSFANYALGAQGTFTNGILRVAAAEAIDQNVFKRAYSAEVIKSAAQRFGWQAKQTNENQFQVTRRV